VSKKTKPRRSAAASQARPSQARSAQARPSQPGASRASQPVTDQGPEQTEADAIVRRVLGDLWKAVAAGEPLQAEIEASTCMEIPRVLGVRDPAEEEQFRATVLVEGAVRRRNPEGAALTLQYDKVLYLVDTIRENQRLAGKRVTVIDYPDGRIKIRYDGRDLGYREFDKLTHTHQGEVVSHKRLGAVLTMLGKEQKLLSQEKRSLRCPTHRYPAPARLT